MNDLFKELRGSLKTKVSIGKELDFSIGAFLLFLVYILSFSVIVEGFGNIFPGVKHLYSNNILSFFKNIAEEEACYRFFPLVLAIEKWGNSNKVLVVAVVASIFFGLDHAHHPLFFKMFVQGAFGLILSIVFLKCGGFNKNYFKAFATTTVMHAIMSYSLIHGVFYLEL
jgi:hypothetical protein